MNQHPPRGFSAYFHDVNIQVYLIQFKYTSIKHGLRASPAALKNAVNRSGIFLLLQNKIYHYHKQDISHLCNQQFKKPLPAVSTGKVWPPQSSLLPDAMYPLVCFSCLAMNALLSKAFSQNESEVKLNRYNSV